MPAAVEPAGVAQVIAPGAEIEPVAELLVVVLLPDGSSQAGSVPDDRAVWACVVWMETEVEMVAVAVAARHRSAWVDAG